MDHVRVVLVPDLLDLLVMFLLLITLHALQTPGVVGNGNDRTPGLLFRRFKIINLLCQIGHGQRQQLFASRYIEIEKTTFIACAVTLSVVTVDVVTLLIYRLN